MDGICSTHMENRSAQVFVTKSRPWRPLRQ